MVPCACDHRVGESVTQSAVESFVSWILPYKLEEVTRVLDNMAWAEKKELNRFLVFP